MKCDARTLQRIIKYCQKQWTEADQAQAAQEHTAVQTGRKMAYSDVMQFASELLKGPSQLDRR